jgi:hypothetical protein
MSIEKSKQAKKIRVGNHYAKVILLYLADCHNSETGRCDPTQETIAADLETSRDSVIRGLGLLDDLGLISRVKIREAGRVVGTNFDLLLSSTRQRSTQQPSKRRSNSLSSTRQRSTQQPSVEMPVNTGVEVKSEAEKPKSGAKSYVATGNVADSDNYINGNIKEEDTKKEESLFVGLFENDSEIRAAIVAKIGIKKKVDPITSAEWADMVAVWNDWTAEMEKNANARLTPRRGRAILDRFRSVQRYTPADIAEAIRGNKLSPKHNGTGQGGDGTVYDDIELICRDDDNVERFRGHYEAFRDLNGGKAAGGVVVPGRFDHVGKMDYDGFNNIEFDARKRVK